MNLWEMIVLVVGIGAVAKVLVARYTGGERPHDNRGVAAHADPDAIRLGLEVTALKERIAVLERLATDEHGARSLDREIEKLR